MLMGILDTLASHRANILRILLPSAVAFGTTEHGNDESSLKVSIKCKAPEPFVELSQDMDTNEPISDPDDGDCRFYLGSVVNDAKVRDSCLADMQARWISANPDQRQAIPDSEWLIAMTSSIHYQAKSSIHDQAKRSIGFVQRWITTHLRRFRLENADIKVLDSQFE